MSPPSLGIPNAHPRLFPRPIRYSSLVLQFYPKNLSQKSLTNSRIIHFKSYISGTLPNASSLFYKPIMDPVSSSSSTSATPPNHDNNRLNRQFKTTQPVTDRIARALRHPLFLLHRADSNFFILGATGNVYTVTLCAAPSCTCPDRTTPCKHILFVLIRVLGVLTDDTCESGSAVNEMEEGTVCPVCLEEMEKGEKMVACSTCRNLIHEECLMIWKRSRGRRSANCVICRARWSTDQEKYLNLAAYISQDAATEGSSGGGGAAVWAG